jgi:hypothetical protein
VAIVILLQHWIALAARSTIWRSLATRTKPVLNGPGGGVTIAIKRIGDFLKEQVLIPELLGFVRQFLRKGLTGQPFLATAAIWRLKTALLMPESHRFGHQVAIAANVGDNVTIS